MKNGKNIIAERSLNYKISMAKNTTKFLKEQGSIPLQYEELAECIIITHLQCNKCSVSNEETGVTNAPVYSRRRSVVFPYYLMN